MMDQDQRTTSHWRRIADGIRTIITGRVDVPPPVDDPYVAWLRDQQKAAEESAARYRQNFIEQEFERRRPQ